MDIEVIKVKIIGFGFVFFEEVDFNFVNFVGVGIIYMKII